MMQTTRFLALLSVALGTAGLARATVLLNDTFADGDRTTQNLPASAAFYQGGSSVNQSLDVVSQTLQYSFDNTSGQLGQYVVYFTAEGSPVSLNVGDKLSVSLTFSGDQIVNGADSLRIGLFDSGGSRVSADYSGVANVAFNAYTGYSFFGNMGAGSNTGPCASGPARTTRCGTAPPIPTCEVPSHRSRTMPTRPTRLASSSATSRRARCR